MQDLPDTIYQRWFHLREEDSEGVAVYKPAAYSFPRARGRSGMEFRPNGQFIDLTIGPTDATQEVMGQWHMTGPGQITVTFEETGRPSRVLEIGECSGDTLKVRQ